MMGVSARSAAARPHKEKTLVSPVSLGRNVGVGVGGESDCRPGRMSLPSLWQSLRYVAGDKAVLQVPPSLVKKKKLPGSVQTVPFVGITAAPKPERLRRDRGCRRTFKWPTGIKTYNP